MGRREVTRRTVIRLATGAALTKAVMSLPGGGRALAEGPTDHPVLRTDSDVEALLPRLSNWGRWGEGDRRGTLNLITPERRRAAAAEVRVGRAISLGRESRVEAIERGAHEMTIRPFGSRDFVGMVFHGFEMTHLDGLAHVFADEERMYNSVPRTNVTEAGAAALGVEVFGAEGIVGRGVLLDVARLRGGPLEPGTAIYPRDLETAEEAQGVRVGPGDLLFVRTGAGRANTRERRSGLHPECLAWLRFRDVALLSGDGDSDVAPLEGFERWASAMHTVAIPYLGLPLIDNADLDPLSVACAEEGRWSFLATVAPLRVPGLTGSPVNPMALL